MFLRRTSRPLLPVLMYHDLLGPSVPFPGSHEPHTPTTAAFRAQLVTLLDLRMAVTRLDSHLASSAGTGAVPPACVMTFDDGHESNLALALPLLQEFGSRATFFVTVDWIGTSGYLTWPQVRTLADAGMEIGSHSMTHRPPSTLSSAELSVELRESKMRIEDRVGRPVL